MNEFNDRIHGDDAGKSPATANEDHTDRSSQPVLQPERIIVHCPHCNSSLRVRRAYIGGVVRCKQCNQDFLVPPPEGTQPAAFSDGSPGFEPTGSHNVGSSTPSDRGAGAMGPLLDQLARFVAVQEELRSAHQELLAERNGVRDELESTRTSLSRTSGELEAIRSALETMASDVVSALSANTEPLRRAQSPARRKPESGFRLFGVPAYHHSNRGEGARGGSIEYTTRTGPSGPLLVRASPRARGGRAQGPARLARRPARQAA